MRRKQLYAIILAGALATGGAPVSAMAAEAGTGENTEELTSDAAEAPAESTEEAPAEETPAEETAEAPAEEAAAEPAEEAPAAEAVEETADTPTEAPTDTPQEPTGIAINKADGSGTTYYKTLQEAVDAVAPYSEENPDATVIEVSTQVALPSTITISDKKICIRATEDCSITRESDSFTGDMFCVSGENAELQLEVADGKSLTVNGVLTSGQASDGSIVSVSDSGSFGLNTGVTLTGSTSTAEGAAINCKGGSIVLSGGTVTGNTGAKGAVYSDSDIIVQGSVQVTDNVIESSQANVYLDATAKFVILNDMEGSKISFTHGNAADGVMVIEGAATVDFEKAVAQFSYDTEEYTLNADTSAKTASLKKAETPTATPEPTAVPTQGPTATPTKTPTATPTQKPSVTPTKAPSFLTYKSGSLKWENHTTASLKMSVTKNCKWYYFYVDSGTKVETIQAMYDASRATNVANANTEFTVTAENVPEADTWLVVCAKPDSGKAQMRVFKLDSASFKQKRPAAANPSVTTRAARTHKVSESTVSGLENPMKFTPGTFYEFSVTGAGQNDEAPYVSGDERWIPMYWSTAENPSSSQKNTTFRIGSAKGIAEAKTYNIYIFFKKQIYNGAEWQDTDVIESITKQFSSQELTNADLTVTPTDGANGGDGGSGSGSSTDAELTATEAATEKANGSSSKSAVSTMDESPIGTMVALAALSLLAGGYILIRRRKKDI